MGSNKTLRRQARRKRALEKRRQNQPPRWSFGFRPLWTVVINNELTEDTRRADEILADIQPEA